MSRDVSYLLCKSFKTKMHQSLDDIETLLGMFGDAFTEEDEELIFECLSILDRCVEEEI